MLLTTSYSAALGWFTRDSIMVNADPAEPPPTFVPPPTSPRIISLGLLVETDTLPEELEVLEGLLAVEGSRIFGSKGVTVFAPETPKTINEYCGGEVLVAVTVIVTLDSGEEATAHHSPSKTPNAVGVVLALKVRPLAVAVPKLKGPPPPTPAAKAIMMSLGFEVVNVAEHEEAPGVLHTTLDAAPSRVRVGAA